MNTIAKKLWQLYSLTYACEMTVACIVTMHIMHATNVYTYNHHETYI